MASEVQICNLALSNVGNRGRVASISPVDGSAEADYCASFFGLARNEMLEMFDWTFARKRVALALLATNPSSLWLYAYSLPSDCLKPRRVLTSNGATEQDSEPFDIEGTTLLTNKQYAELSYTRTVTDAGLFPPSFVTALGYLLSSYLAGPLLKGIDGTRANGEFRKIATQMGASAAASDANNSDTPIEWVPSNIAARNGMVGSTQPTAAPVTPGSGYVII
jgi:hypothetical protein